ncbi:MAG: hypothetical protein U5Q03_16070 [Bacteroidota bacterium]|nr:hypothetical protein [Bacteroidota bacterium]
MKRRTGLIIVLLFSALMINNGCSLTRKMFGERYKNERKMQQQEKESAKTYEKIKEVHFNRQPERTQEMMKESRKRNKQLKRSRQAPWWKRLLGIDK